MRKDWTQKLNVKISFYRNILGLCVTPIISLVDTRTTGGLIGNLLGIY